MWKEKRHEVVVWECLDEEGHQKEGIGASSYCGESRDTLSKLDQSTAHFQSAFPYRNMDVVLPDILIERKQKY